MYREINFDGLVGPSHNYGGLSVDNFASDANRASASRPKSAALQGLQKMKTLMDAGYVQGVIPPLERPSILHLKQFGISGITDDEVLKQAMAQDPALLAACSSASSMWTANAATVAPSCDTSSGVCRWVVANLFSKLHRSIEANETFSVLRAIFGPHVLPALEGGMAMSDEGAANHTRLCEHYGDPGLHLFVYGREHAMIDGKFLARQTKCASETVARKLGLPQEQCLFLPQNQDVIDQGVFHNDVIAVGNLNCYFFHEDAFACGIEAEEQLCAAYENLTGKTLVLVQAKREDISVKDAVQTYLFNSQLIGEKDHMILIAPVECETNPRVSAYLKSLTQNADNPIKAVRYFNLKESMRNGGGPACLRLRVVLNEEEINALQSRVILDDYLYSDLVDWVQAHYRDQLSPSDLADPQLLHEVRIALAELTNILELGPVYPFQVSK